MLPATLPLITTRLQNQSLAVSLQLKHTIHTNYYPDCRSAALPRGPADGEEGHVCMFDQAVECKTEAKSL